MPHSLFVCDSGKVWSGDKQLKNFIFLHLNELKRPFIKMLDHWFRSSERVTRSVTSLQTIGTERTSASTFWIQFYKVHTTLGHSWAHGQHYPSLGRPFTTSILNYRRGGKKGMTMIGWFINNTLYITWNLKPIQIQAIYETVKMQPSTDITIYFFFFQYCTLRTLLFAKELGDMQLNNLLYKSKEGAVH